MQELIFLEDQVARTKNLDRIDVLEKVGNLLLLPNKDFATTKQVAEFFKVSIETVKSSIKDNKTELENNGLFLLKGQELKEFKASFDGNYSGLSKKINKDLILFKTKTILKLAFLLTNSEKAKQLRQEIFNYDKELYSELSHTTSLRSKKKEEFCFENIKINFPQVKIERQKKIKNYSVDFCLNDTIYLEIDEYGHSGYNNQNETKRTETIEKEIGKKLIRFNPDKQQPFELICTIAEVLKCKN